MLQVSGVLAPAAYRIGLRSAYGITIVTCFLALQTHVYPFEYKYMNYLESATLFIGVITMAAASMQMSGGSVSFDDGNPAGVASAVAVVTNAALGIHLILPYGYWRLSHALYQVLCS